MQAGAGVELHAKPGDDVRAGEPLLTLHTDEPERFERALEALEGADRVGGVRRRAAAGDRPGRLAAGCGPGEGAVTPGVGGSRGLNGSLIGRRRQLGTRAAGQRQADPGQGVVADRVDGPAQLAAARRVTVTL